MSVKRRNDSWLPRKEIRYESWCVCVMGDRGGDRVVWALKEKSTVKLLLQRHGGLRLVKERMVASFLLLLLFAYSNDNDNYFHYITTTTTTTTTATITTTTDYYYCL